MGSTDKEKGTIKLKAGKHLEPKRAGLLSGGPLRVPYLFQEMHFHWGNLTVNGINGLMEWTGSEHLIDGEGAILELHMVHKNIHDQFIDESKGHEDGLTVLAFRFGVVGKKDDRFEHNEGLDNLANITQRFLKKLGSKFEEKDSKRTNLDLSVMQFLPVLMDEYFYYKGSLTTGGCDEAVNWIVFKNHLTITTRQIIRLTRIFDKSGAQVVDNYRETQEVNDRPIYYHGEELLKTGVIGIGSNPQVIGLERPTKEKFFLTLPNCLNYHPAPMYDYRTDKKNRKDWRTMDCVGYTDEMEKPQERTSFTRDPQ